MLIVLWYLVSLIAPVICDRPSLSSDQHVELGPHVAIELKRHNFVANFDVNHTVSGHGSLQAPDEQVITFASQERALGFDVMVSKEGKYIVQSVNYYGKAFEDLDPGMQILQINKRPVEEMTQNDVLRACRENKPNINELLIRMPGSSQGNSALSTTKADESNGSKSNNPRAVSHFARNGDFASDHLQYEFCLALHRHKHGGLPIYSESVLPAHAKESDKPWSLILVCPKEKTSEELDRMRQPIRDAYESHKETASIVAQAVQKKGHKAMWLADKARMIFNKERHTLSVDLGVPLNPQDAYARLGVNLTRQRSPAIPDVLQHADCRLIVQFYFVPTWDENALAKGEWVSGNPRADFVATIQCCTASSSPCTEPNRRWWKTFV